RYGGSSCRLAEPLENRLGLRPQRIDGRLARALLGQKTTQIREELFEWQDCRGPNAGGGLEILNQGPQLYRQDAQFRQPIRRLRPRRPLEPLQQLQGSLAIGGQVDRLRNGSGGRFLTPTEEVSRLVEQAAGALGRLAYRLLGHGRRRKRPGRRGRHEVLGQDNLGTCLSG